jgi:CRISPR/Cas system-associated exonuclease Cas4 (RecB family)
VSIYISATAIKDYLVCPKKIDYKTKLSGTTEGTPDMQAGTIVHETIEKCWNSKKNAIDYCNVKLKEYGLEQTYADKALKSTRNFFDSGVYSMLSKSDLVEHKFKIALDKENFLVGRMDRITKDGIVIDWKTSTKTPSSIDRDPQFLTYFWAYKSSFKKAPTAVLYVSLYENKIVRFKYNANVMNQLFKGIIPSMITKIRKNDLPPIGFFNNACYGCPFKTICYSEIESNI